MPSTLFVPSNPEKPKYIPTLDFQKIADKLCEHFTF
jgi:hypothetical protein